MACGFPQTFLFEGPVNRDPTERLHRPAELFRSQTYNIGRFSQGAGLAGECSSLGLRETNVPPGQEIVAIFSSNNGSAPSKNVLFVASGHRFLLFSLRSRPDRPTDTKARINSLLGRGFLY